MAVRFLVKGIGTVQAMLAGVKIKIDRDVSKSMPKVGLYVQGKIKESIARGTNAPVTVDTGRFLNSIDFKPRKDSVVIFSQVPYAKYLEYGTSRMPARPHFRNTKNKEKNKIKDIIRGGIK